MMKAGIKRVGYGVCAAFAAVLLVAVLFQRRGATANVRLSDKYLDEVTSVTLRYPNGALFTALDINKDFLHVINLWEIDEIISDSLARALRSTAPIRLTLKHNRKTLYKKKGYLQNGEFFLDAGTQGLYKMRCDYLARTWTDFFVAGSPLWRNALLIDLDYFDIQRVAITTFPDSATYVLLRQDIADTVRYTLSRPQQAAAEIPTPQAQVYLTAFKQVYYDDIVNGCDTLGPALYALHIQTLQGTSYAFCIHPHNLFKALVTTPTDTLLVPHLSLDKLLTLTKF